MYNPFKLFLFIIFIFLLIFIPMISIADVVNHQDKFTIKYGVMKSISKSIGKLVETKEIVLDPERRSGWCFIVHPSTEEEYSVYSIHYLPDNPDKLTGDFEDFDPSDSQKGFKTDIEQVNGITPFCFDFHEGDPLGKYRVDVFINQELYSTLYFSLIQ